MDQNGVVVNGNNNSKCKKNTRIHLHPIEGLATGELLSMEFKAIQGPITMSLSVVFLYYLEIMEVTSSIYV